VRTHQVEWKAATSAVPDFVDITDDVQRLLGESGIEDGQVTVFSPQPGCSLVANERETGLLDDIKTAMQRIGASSKNGQTIIGSNSLVVPAVKGLLRLGTWQRLLLVELKEPSSRAIVVQIVGE
jgi:secondary thiamine-phosphate synthase enzyme